MATNYLSRRSSAAVNLNLSTLTGSAITTSTITVSTLNLQSTTISLGQSTNQTYNNFSNGSYLTWTTAKSAMTSANKTVQSANGLYQMLVANATSGLFLSSDSGITWSTLSGGLPTLTGSAYWSDGAISANGQYITLSIYGGSLWMSADYGRTFALTNQPTPNIWLPLNGNTTDLMGSSTVTATGSPGYVTLNYPGYTAQAVNLLNTAGAAPTRYIRGTWTGASNFTVSLWFNAQALTSVYQTIFSAYAGAFKVSIANNNTLYLQIPSGGAFGTSSISFTALTVNTWYYVTAIFQTSGLCSLYVNNTLIGSLTNSQGVGSFTTTQFSLGTNDDSTTQAFNGYVDDIRITNSVSTYVPIPLLQPNIWLPFENTAGDLGSHSLAPGATPTIYLPFEGNLTDSMGASTVTATGAVTYPTGYIGQALRLTNPTGGTAEQFVRGTWTSPSIYTVSGWFNLQTSTATGNQFIFSTGGTSGPNAVILYINTNTQLAAQVPNGVTIVAPVTISVNIWYSFTLKVYPSGRQCSLYFNNSIYSAAATATATPSGTFGIGTFDVGGTSSAFNGLIDDFRITNFDVPLSIVSVTGSLSYVPGVVGLNAVNIANTASGTAANYIRGAWNYFNNFTVSGWVNIQSLASSFQVIYSSHNAIIEIFLNPSGQLVAQLPTGSGASYNNIITTFPISINTWYHLVMIFQINGLCSFLVNGSVIGTFTNSGGYGTVTSSGVFCLGTYDAGTSYAFNGYIDDFRIYNAVIPYHTLFPQNYRSLALSGTGQYALAAAASGWVVGSSNSSQTWSKQAVNVGTQVPATPLVYVGTQGDTIQPNKASLTQNSWEQNGVNWASSVSSVLSGIYAAYFVFNGVDAGDSWTSAQTYTNGPYTGSVSTTVIGIGAVTGEWIQIQSSIPLVIQSYRYTCAVNAHVMSKYYIVGSTDGTNWFPIQYVVFSSNPFTAWNQPITTSITVNSTGTQSVTAGNTVNLTSTAYASSSTNVYNYFRIIGTETFTGGSYNELCEFYPIFIRPSSISRPPTHALSMNHTGQYQLVATGPAAGSVMPNQTGLAAATWTQGGVNWEASASSVFSVLYPYGAFNNFVGITGTYSWCCANSLYGGTSAAYNGSRSTSISGLSPVLGEWLQLQSSVPLVMTSYTYASGGQAGNNPRIYHIIGSTDGTTWYPIQSAVMTTNPSTTQAQLCTTYITVNQSGTQTIQGGQTGSGTFTTYSTTTNAYTYFRVIATAIYIVGGNYEFNELYINFRNSVSYSSNYGSTWLNTSQTVSNESVALSASGQYALSTNSVAPFARLTLDNTNADAQGRLTIASVVGTSYSDTIVKVGTRSAFFNNTPGASAPTNYLLYTIPTVLNTPPSLTMMGWIHPTSFGSANYPTPFTLCNSTSSSGPAFFVQTNGLMGIVTTTTTNTGGSGLLSSVVASLNTWYHLAVVYGNNTVSLYINGTLNATSSYSGLLCLGGGGSLTHMIIGGNAPTTGGSFAGYVDDVRIYTSALNADEINGIFKNPALTQTIAVSNSYLPITSYTEPVLPGITANVVDTAVSQTGQYMVAVTSSTTNNVYYSTDFGATFTALTIGTAAMVSCSISYDGSYLTVESATTVHTLNRNTRGFALAVGNQAGRINQGLNAIAIGDKAGQTNQSANSIVLNATGTALDAVAPGFYVAPIATTTSSSATSFGLLGYGTDNQVTQTNLTVLSNGNVGIGTTVPVYLFDINGTSATRGVISAPTLNTGQLYNYTVTASAGRWYKVISMPDSQSKVIFRIKGTVVAGSNPHACSYMDVLISTDNVSGSIYPQIKQTDSYNGMSWSDFGLVYVISSGYSTIYIKAAAGVIANLDVTATSKNGTGAISPIIYNSSSVYTLAFGGTMTVAVDTALTGSIVQFDVYTNTNVKYNLMVASTGNVGIGTVAPAAPLHIVAGFGGSTVQPVLGATTNSSFLLTNSSHAYGLNIVGSNTGAMHFQSQYFNGNAGVLPITLNPMGGNVIVGSVTPDSSYALTIRAPSYSGMLTCYNQGGTMALAIYTAQSSINTGWNGNNSVMFVARDTGSGRSINAAGTVNTSGNDYAEYMVKNGDFIVSKGDIVGIDKSGLLTNQYDDAITFVVKSTDPSYVGGDSWGTDERIGVKPKELETSASEEEKAAYQSAKEAWEAALEMERQRVDRIAFSGRVPVNVLGAQSGDYIVPIRNENGTIGGQVVTDATITFSEYKKAVGKVIDILLDGRASIIVKVC